MAGGSCKSFLIAAKLLKSFLQLKISAKQVSLLTTLVGSELRESRDERVDRWKNRQLTQPKTVADPPPQLASVQIDGGRIQTRDVNAGHGVFNPHWRETKNASFHRMATKCFSADPHWELPSCFSSRKIMDKLLSGLSDDVNDGAPETSQTDAKGLPTTSCLIESQIKEMNHRVKGTEKFWNDGHEAEAILQVVTAILSDEELITNHFQTRPGSPFDRKTTPK